MFKYIFLIFAVAMTFGRAAEGGTVVITLNDQTDAANGKFKDNSKHLKLLIQLQERLNKVKLRSLGYDIHLFYPAEQIDPNLRDDLVKKAASASYPVYFPTVDSKDDQQLRSLFGKLESPKHLAPGRCLASPIYAKESIKEFVYKGERLKQNIAAQMALGSESASLAEDFEVIVQPPDEKAFKSVAIQDLLQKSDKEIADILAEQNILVGVDYPNLDEFQMEDGRKVNGVFFLASLLEGLSKVPKETLKEPRQRIVIK